MRIEHSSELKYIRSLNEELKGQELFAPVLVNNETILFPLVENNHKGLAISLNHSTPLVYLVDDNRFYSSFETPFFLRFKKLIQKSVLKDISLDEKDNLVAITFEIDDEILDKKNIHTFIELIPSKPNMIVSDENDIIIEAFYKDKNRSLLKGEKYVRPTPLPTLDKGESISKEIITQHFENELVIRHKEKYQAFHAFVNGKIKTKNRKIKAIQEDVKKAEENLKYSEYADEIFTLGINMKSHLKEVELSSGKISLDESKTVLENVEHFYKRAKKAKETILRSESNIKSAQDEITSYQELIDRFNKCDEKDADKLMNEIGMIKKKKEVKETPFNRPYKINYNGTIIYFGRNASQNDYLSFVMKLDREFTWLHIKDKSGAHLVICNKNPTEKELLLACELSLLCSRAASGEIVYTKKKNVRRGHTLGEAILKNHSVIRLNSVSKETKEIFLTAERLK